MTALTSIRLTDCANGGEDPKRERPDDPEGLDSYPS